MSLKISFFPELPAFLLHQSDGHSSGSTDAKRERNRVVDAKVLRASSRRPDPNFKEAKKSLAPDLIACWIRPRVYTSKLPVLLTQGTGRKLRAHKVAL